MSSFFAEWSMNIANLHEILESAGVGEVDEVHGVVYLHWKMHSVA